MLLPKPLLGCSINIYLRLVVVGLCLLMLLPKLISVADINGLYSIHGALLISIQFLMSFVPKLITLLCINHGQRSTATNRSSTAL